MSAKSLISSLEALSLGLPYSIFPWWAVRKEDVEAGGNTRAAIAYIITWHGFWVRENVRSESWRKTRQR